MTAIAFEPAGFTVPALLDNLIRGLRALHARRSRRQQLRSLLSMENHRLDDMGLTRSDVADAIAAL